MNYLEMILKNTSLWEVIVFFVVLYLLFRPSLLKTITKVKLGDLEIELNALKEQVTRGEEYINELEAELESERRLFEDLLDNFDPDAPLKELSETRRAIKASAKNVEEVESLKRYLSLNATPEELYVAAVAIKERRPTILIPEIVALLNELAMDKNLGGYRLNTIWTLTSALHLTLLAAIRDGISPTPGSETLLKAEKMLNVLEDNPTVQSDRPDNPMKGIRGPIKHCRTWVNKGFSRNQNRNSNT
jgi:hypothetical protein